jgi:hypothetical protein
VLFAGVVLASDQRSLPLPTQDLDEANRRMESRVAVIYVTLAALPFAEQRRLLLEIRPFVQVALWTRNLDIFVAAHPTLNADQRAIISEARIVLAMPRFFDAIGGTDEARAKALALDALKARAHAAFGREMLVPLFLRLGEEPLSGIVSDSRAPSRESGPTYCNCNSWYDCNPIWPSVVCYNSPETFCRDIRGCGWFSTELCDGIC